MSGAGHLPSAALQVIVRVTFAVLDDIAFNITWTAIEGDLDIELCS